MGIFKEIKSMAQDSPTRIAQAQRLAAYAQPMNTAREQQSDPWPGASTRVRPTAPGAADFEPIATVSLELYAQISKSLATIDYDLSQSIRLAVDKGISEENWTFAVEGWNARMAVNPAVGSRFSALYAAS